MRGSRNILLEFSVTNVRQTSSIFCCWCRVGEIVRYLDCLCVCVCGGDLCQRNKAYSTPPTGEQTFEGVVKARKRSLGEPIARSTHR